MKAIIYTSNTGTTAAYAKLLGERTGLPVYPLEEAKSIEAKAEIIYLGWLMAGSIKGYKKAAKKWKIAAVCAVGMSSSKEQEVGLYKSNKIEPAIPVFNLLGGFDITKLHGVYKIMMQMMSKTMTKKLAEKTEKTLEEERLYEMLLHGGNYVSEDNLREVYEWLHKANV